MDVLSFSTAVDIAVSRGAEVLPYRWNDASARSYAESKRARLAAPRSQADYSLSPASLESIQPGDAVVLPSPNGSELSLKAAAIARTFCACLRNAPAVAMQIRSVARPVAVIPAGEQWDDGSLRPALEDLIGAGAVIASLTGTLSPEAELALAAFEKFRSALHDTIRSCGAGRELTGRGSHRDIELASHYGASHAVPIVRTRRDLSPDVRRRSYVRRALPINWNWRQVVGESAHRPRKRGSRARQGFVREMEIHDRQSAGESRRPSGFRERPSFFRKLALHRRTPPPRRGETE